MARLKNTDAEREFEKWQVFETWCGAGLGAFLLGTYLADKNDHSSKWFFLGGVVAFAWVMLAQELQKHRDRMDEA